MYLRNGYGLKCGLMTNQKGLCSLGGIKCRVDLWSKKMLWLPPLLGRLSMAAIFVPSGWGKLHNLDSVIKFFTELGIPFPQYQAPFVAGVEFFFGALLLLGLLTRFATLPLIISMVVAIITAKKDDIHSIVDLLAVDEYLYIVILVGLLVWGAGCLSLDHLLCRKGTKDATQGNA